MKRSWRSCNHYLGEKRKRKWKRTHYDIKAPHVCSTLWLFQVAMLAKLVMKMARCPPLTMMEFSACVCFTSSRIDLLSLALPSRRFARLLFICWFAAGFNGVAGWLLIVFLTRMRSMSWRLQEQKQTVLLSIQFLFLFAKIPLVVLKCLFKNSFGNCAKFELCAFRQLKIVKRNRRHLHNPITYSERKDVCFFSWPQSVLLFLKILLQMQANFV